mgnify:CR=1 FL=1
MSTDQPEYRRVMEAALRAYEAPAADEALVAYRDDPLLLIHHSHYPVMYRALRAYQHGDSNPSVDAVIEQVEYAMTGHRPG